MDTARSNIPKPNIKNYHGALVAAKQAKGHISPLTLGFTIVIDMSDEHHTLFELK